MIYLRANNRGAEEIAAGAAAPAFRRIHHSSPSGKSGLLLSLQAADYAGHDFSILREENEAVKVFRIALSANVAKVVRLGMGLLGIEVPARM